MKHAVVVVSHGEIDTAKTFASSELAAAFAEGVRVGADAMNDHGDVETHLFDDTDAVKPALGRGLKASNEIVAAAIGAGWEMDPE